ncbi:MAG: hypothetical protein ABW047_01440 [Nitrospiraceae bacterium]
MAGPSYWMAMVFRGVGLDSVHSVHNFAGAWVDQNGLFAYDYVLILYVWNIDSCSSTVSGKVEPTVI